MNQTTELSKALLDKGQLGVVGFDFSKNIPDLFIVALEGGLIVRCSMLGATQLKGTHIGIKDLKQTQHVC